MAEPPSEADELASLAVDAAYHLHRDLGPSLLESVYETILDRSLRRQGVKVDRQKPIDIYYQGLFIRDAFRVDLLLNDLLVVELKSSEKMAPVYGKQVLTYLRLMKLPLGLLINFGMPSAREGIRRVVNSHHSLAPLRLGVRSSSQPS